MMQTDTNDNEKVLSKKISDMLLDDDADRY
jgi:hypothetical protein